MIKKSLALTLGALMGLAIFAGSADASTFDFSFSGSGYFGLGTFITTGTSSPYTVIDIVGGTASDPFLNGGTPSPITGVTDFDGADNQLTYPASPTYIDLGGISFSTLDGNLYNLNFFNGYNVYSPNNPNPDDGIGSPLESFTVTATPLPSTWTMLIAGFIGLGFFVHRGAKSRSACVALV